MKSPFRSRVPLLALAGLLSGFLSVTLVSLAVAQDRITFKDNRVQDGKIAGVSNGNVVINAATASGGAAQLQFPIAQVAQVQMVVPPTFNSGMTAYQTANWDRALADLDGVAKQFRGLPTEWARQTSEVIGDIYLEKNDVVKAEASYNEFRRYYPTAGNSLRISVGLARVAYAKNNAAAAKQQLDVITQAALKAPASVTRFDGAAYGQAFYLLAQLQEKEGKFQDALTNYLRTVTLFYQDAGVTAKAKKNADGLRASQKGLVAL